MQTIHLSQIQKIFKKHFMSYWQKCVFTKVAIYGENISTLIKLLRTSGEDT